MSDTSNFKKYILPVIITGAFMLAGVFLTYQLSKDETKLSSREKTETRSPDGTIIKREMEIYK